MVHKTSHNNKKETARSEAHYFAETTPLVSLYTLLRIRLYPFLMFEKLSNVVQGRKKERKKGREERKQERKKDKKKERKKERKKRNK